MRKKIVKVWYPTNLLKHNYYNIVIYSSTDRRASVQFTLVLILSVEVGENKIDGHPLQSHQKPTSVLGGRSGRENELLGELYAHGQGHHVGRAVQGLSTRSHVRKRLQRFAVRYQEHSTRDRY